MSFTSYEGMLTLAGHAVSTEEADDVAAANDDDDVVEVSTIIDTDGIIWVLTWISSIWLGEWE